MSTLDTYQNCLLCGKENPIGLHLHFTEEKHGVSTVWVTQQNYEGYQNSLHGGITAALLDEIMAQAIIIKGEVAVTASMNVRYKNPIEINQTITIYGEVTEQKGKLFYCSAEIRSVGDVLLASATAVYARI